MNFIKTYYLIDFENVGCEGFKGCEKLGETDFIHLFYTDNSRKIDIDIINDHGRAELITHKVPTGKQSADMHLGSYLGYLVGMECMDPKEECKFVIISKDTGFDHVIEFWKAEKGVKISRSEKISGKQIQTKKQTDQQKIQNDTKTQKAEQSSKIQVQKIIGIDTSVQKLQKEINRILNQAGMPKDVSNYVSCLVGQNINDEKRKQKIHNAVVVKYGNEKGLKIYNSIKKQI